MLTCSKNTLKLRLNLCQNVVSAIFCKHNLKTVPVVRRRLHINSRLRQTFKVLGIETSCDDTGCAVVDSNGNLLGESLKSQLSFHNANGGIIPPLAASLHKQNIVSVVDEALSRSGITIQEVSAIATTVKPGIGGPLDIGIEYGTHLAEKYQKPFIPIHHMEAHALAVRMIRKDVQFPFLTLLISGGHTLVAIARSVERFELMGDAGGLAIGDVLDKVARRLKLFNLPEYRNMSGGRAIEVAASKSTNINQYIFPRAILKGRSCDFTFTGIHSYCTHLIEKTENEYGVEGDALIPNVENFCAGLQLHLAHFLCLKVQYAMTAVRDMHLIADENPFLVVSGGAACNRYFCSALEKLCDVMEFRFAVPPPKLCTDNGVMIAWNGVEKILADSEVIPSNEAKNVRAQPSCPLGVDIRESVNEFRHDVEKISLERLFGS